MRNGWLIKPSFTDQKELRACQLIETKNPKKNCDFNLNQICPCLWRSQADFTLGSGFPDRFQWIVWSSTGHSLVAASNNDLYYIGDVTKASVTSHRLTSTGEFNTFYNGMADRLYEGKFSVQSLFIFFPFIHKINIECVVNNL